MSCYDGLIPIYTYHLSIEREDRPLLDVTVTAKGEAEDIGKANRSILRLLKEYTPKIVPMPIPATACEETEEQTPDSCSGTPAQAGDGARQPMTFGPGIKGAVYLKCPVCENKFHACLRDYQESIPCKCGHMIDLTDPTIVRYDYSCPACGRNNYGKTNIEDPEYTETFHCGELVKLRWSKSDKRYKGVTPEGRQ